MLTKTCARHAIASLFTAGVMATASPAQAQSAPPPVGVWNSPSTPTSFVINADGSCGYSYQGQVVRTGSCSWNPSSRGGILTLTYAMPLEPGRASWPIQWINQRTITIAGETFRRQ